MEIVKSSLPCTVLEVEYGVDAKGEPSVSDDIVTVTVGSQDVLYKSFYGNCKKIKLSYDSELGPSVHVGKEMYINEVGYMFTSRDEKAVTTLRTIPARHRNDILDKIDSVKAGLDDDYVRTYLYSRLTDEPDYARPITRETIGENYSPKIQSKVIKEINHNQ